MLTIKQTRLNPLLAKPIGRLVAIVFGIFFLSPAHSFAANSGPTPQELTKSLKENPIITDLNTIVTFLSAAVGIIVVGVIITGGVQYTLAGEAPEAVSKAKKRIINGVIALVTFLLMFAFLQWIIPGGVF